MPEVRWKEFLISMYTLFGEKKKFQDAEEFLGKLVKSCKNEPAYHLMSQFILPQDGGFLQCKKCNHFEEKTAYEGFSLRVDLKADGERKVSNLIEEKLKRNETNRPCTGNECDGTFDEIETMPLRKQLVVKLNRDQKGTTVDECKAEYEVFMDVCAYDNAMALKTAKYRLDAVVAFSGNVSGSGHYYAHVADSERIPESGARKWYWISNHVVETRSVDAVLDDGLNAYLLFYTQIPAEDGQ